MNSKLYFYADETSLAVLDSQDEKILLVGSDFGNGNFGDILQHTNTITLHQNLGRFKCVSVLATSAVGDAQFPEFVRRAYGSDAVIFVSDRPLRLAEAGVPLHPVRAARNIGALHLYGGGFLNDMWGAYVLGVAEFLLKTFQPPIYVVSGQQVTTPFETDVLRHIESYRPAMFGVRDAMSQQWMSEGGYVPEFSFDDATEALQDLSSALPLQRAPGLLMQLNVSDYTNNAADADGLQCELAALAAHESARGGLTILQAFADRREEVVDTRESIKELERAFPFADYRTLELAALAYRIPASLANPVQGEMGYSCSYHVALWLQLAGIPCWLRGSNLFYEQKGRALQVDQDFKAFLRDPHLANHSSNLERRQEWQERLSAVLLSAPNSDRTCVLPSAEGSESAPWQFKGSRQIKLREHAEEMILRAHTMALNAQITELGAICHAQRQRAEAAEASLADTRANPELMGITDVVQLHKRALALTQALTERDGQIDSLNQSVAERDGQIASLNQSVAELNARIRAICDSRSWRLTRPLRFFSGLIRRTR